MSAWDYERIVHAQNAWHDARRTLPPLPPADPNKMPPPLTDEYGPQIVND